MGVFSRTGPPRSRAPWPDHRSPPHPTDTRQSRMGLVPPGRLRPPAAPPVRAPVHAGGPGRDPLQERVGRVRAVSGKVGTAMARSKNAEARRLGRHAPVRLPSRPGTDGPGHGTTAMPGPVRGRTVAAARGSERYGAARARWSQAAPVRCEITASSRVRCRPPVAVHLADVTRHRSHSNPGATGCQPTDAGEAPDQGVQRDLPPRLPLDTDRDRSGRRRTRGRRTLPGAGTRRPPA